MKRQEQKELTKKKIFETAIGMFIEQGYEQVTIDSIAGSIGLTKGAFYHHFISKDAILIEFYNKMIDELVGDLLAAVKDNRTRGGFTIIEAIFAQAERFAREQGTILAILLGPAFKTKAPLEDVFIHEVAVVFQNILAHAKFETVGGPETSARYISTLLYYEIRHFCLQKKGQKNIPAGFGDILRVLEKGIVASG